MNPDVSSAYSTHAAGDVHAELFYLEVQMTTTPQEVRSKINEAFSAFLEKANDHIRTVAFAGVALVWMSHQTGWPIAVKFSILSVTPFIAAIAIDIVYYVFGTLGLLAHLLRQMKSQAPVVRPPPVVSWVLIGIFVVKALAVVVGYTMLFIALWS